MQCKINYKITHAKERRDNMKKNYAKLHIYDARNCACIHDNSSTESHIYVQNAPRC